jgi:hypothetical protein
LGRAEFDQKTDHRQRLVGDPPDSGAAHLDQPGERRGGPHQQAAVRGFDMNMIIADQPCERQRAAPPRLQ